MLHIEPSHLGVIVSLDNGQLPILNLFIIYQNGSIILIILVVVVGKSKTIFIGILVLDYAEVLGIVEGNDIDDVAIIMVELMVDVSDGLGLKVDEVDGGVGGVENYDLLLGEHAKLADHAGVIIAVDHLSFRVDVDDRLGLAWSDHGREDEGAVISSGDSGNFADGLLEIDVGPLFKQHH